MLWMLMRLGKYYVVGIGCHRQSHQVVMVTVGSNALTLLPLLRDLKSRFGPAAPQRMFCNNTTVVVEPYLVAWHMVTRTGSSEKSTGLCGPTTVPLTVLRPTLPTIA